MGEVYRARDTRLSRNVAIKVLPAEFADDARFRARFEREAKTISALNHPHICSLHDIGRENGLDYLVMEYCEGTTLANRLERGALTIEQVLQFGIEIADALSRAHRAGIVHRDLKPSNIMLTKEGVKLLDFGLAKQAAVQTSGGTHATTDLRDPVSEEGTFVGTVAYMAPEVLAGKEADARSDLFAFGAVLYEMLTGTSAFSGTSTPSVMASILEREPQPVRELQPRTPPLLERVIEKCLRKDPDQRWESAHDAAEELRWVRDAPVASKVPVRRSRLGVTVAVILALLALAAIWAARTWLWRRPAVAAEPVRMTAALPRGVTVTGGPGYASSLALSPDGRILVVAGTSEDGLHLYQRALDRLDATPLEGTAGATSPFFSPDGRWIGFFAEGRLRRIPAGGGAAVDITKVPEHTYGASWGPDDQIVLVWGARSRLHAVDMRGGTAEAITTIEDGEEGHYHPEVLSDGRTLLFDDGDWIHALDRVSGRRVRLLEGVAPRYASTGYLIFCRDTTLLAAPFDASRLEITGPVVPLVEGVGDSLMSGTKHYAISLNGTLAYVPAAGTHSLVLVNADGTERLIVEERLSFENPQFSPDGRRLAVATGRRTGDATEIWVHDLETGTASRLTFDGGRAPVWTPDGAAVTYSHSGERKGIYRKSADGRGDAEQLIALDEFHWLVGWTPDARTLAFGGLEGQRDIGTSPSSIWALSAGKLRRVVGPGSVWGGRLSPDGRWLGYYLLESGAYEVYVTPFPEGGTRWLISEDGGRDPSWGPDGRELYYRSRDRLIAAQIDMKTGGRVLSRRIVMEPFRPPLYDDYDIHPDGRTLVIVRPAANVAGQVTLVVNWHEELKRLVPTH